MLKMAGLLIALLPPWGQQRDVTVVQSANGQPVEGKRRVILVGVDDYESDRIPDLRYCLPETQVLAQRVGQAGSVPGAPAESAAGQVKTIALPGGATMDLVWVPAGSFMMGSNEGQDDERPVHRVELGGFWMGRTEVTVAQWRSVMGPPPASSYDGKQYNNEGDDRPVVCVSWEDAQAFCQKAGLAVPTEAQWEYAARGPEARVYPWGNQWDRTRCHVFGLEDTDRRTVAVGRLGAEASWCGALDMVGNVEEWCRDWYDEAFYASSEATTRNPECATRRSEFRAVRGPIWALDVLGCRSADRLSGRPAYRDYRRGFRVCGSGSGLVPATPETHPTAEVVVLKVGDQPNEETEEITSETRTFAPNTPTIFVSAGIEGLTPGETVKATLIAIDVTASDGTKVADYEVVSAEVEAPAPESTALFRFGAPTKGWPVGSYEVKLEGSGKLIQRIRLAVREKRP